MRTGPISPKMMMPPHQPNWLKAALIPEQHICIVDTCRQQDEPKRIPLIFMGYISERTMYAMVLYYYAHVYKRWRIIPGGSKF